MIRVGPENTLLGKVEMLFDDQVHGWWAIVDRCQSPNDTGITYMMDGRGLRVGVCCVLCESGEDDETG